MRQPSESLLRRQLPAPARGASTRCRLGRQELVLEAAGGGFVLMVLDGAEARKFWLGLDGSGELEVAMLPPRLPLRLALREPLTLVAGARLRAYVLVPLVPVLRWISQRGAVDVIAELLPQDLQAEWDDGEGCVQRFAASLLARAPRHGHDGYAALLLSVHNRTDHLLQLGELPIRLADDELIPMRDRLHLLPRRLRFTPDGVETQVRRLPGVRR